MAVLKIDVIVNDADAEAKLDRIESKVKNVTQVSEQHRAAIDKIKDSYTNTFGAADTSAKATEKYTESLSKASTEAVKTASAVETLGAAKAAQVAVISKSGQAYVEEQMAISKATYEMNAAKAASLEMSAAQTGLASSISLTTAGAVGLGGYLGLAVSAGLLWTKFLYDSGVAYLEHTGKIEEFKTAIDSIKDTWQNMQIAVGAILLSDLDDVTSWAEGVKEATIFAGSFVLNYVAQQVAAFKMLKNAYLGEKDGTGDLPPAPGAPAMFQGQSSVGALNTKGFFRQNEVASSFSFGSPASGGGGTKAAASSARADAESLRESVQSLRADIQAVNYYVSNIPTFDKLKPIPPTPSMGFTSGIQGSTLPGQQFGIPEIPKGPSIFESAFGTAAQFGSQLASVVMGAVKSGTSIWENAGSFLGSKLGAGLAKQLSGSLTGLLGGAISAMLPVVGALLGPLLGKIKGLFGNQVKDLINDSFGSYGGLREALNPLGAQGDQMWIQLTQQTGKGDVASARSQIEAINAALETHKQKLNETAVAATQAGAAESAAFTKAKDALSQLDQQIQGLQQSIANEAPEEVMGVIEAQTRAHIAALEEQRRVAQTIIDQLNAQQVVIPVRLDTGGIDLPGIQRGEMPEGWTPPMGDEGFEVPEMATGGIVRARPGGTLVRVGEAGRDEAIVPLGSGSGGGTAIIQIDGRTLAEIVVPNLHGVVKRFRVGTR